MHRAAETVRIHRSLLEVFCSCRVANGLQLFAGSWRLLVGYASYTRRTCYPPTHDSKPGIASIHAHHLSPLHLFPCKYITASSSIQGPLGRVDHPISSSSITSRVLTVLLTVLYLVSDMTQRKWKKKKKL